MVSLIGLWVQAAATAVIALMLHGYARRIERRRFYEDWRSAFACYAVAIAALVVCTWVETHLDRVVHPLVYQRGLLATHAVYLVFKLGFAYFLVRGAFALAERKLPFARTRDAWILILVCGVSYAWLADHLHWAIVFQAPLLIAAMFLAASTLLTIAPERRNFGTRFTASVLFVFGSYWIAYATSNAILLDGMKAADAANRTLAAITGAGSIVDTLFEVLLGFGFTTVLFLELDRDRAHEHARAVELERRLAESDKLRALGGLVSGVAHEINNPLTAVIGFTEELLAQPRSAEDRHALEIVREQAERCRRIVGDLLSTVGGQRDRREQVDARTLVERVVAGLAPEAAKRGTRVEVEVEAELGQIEADRVGLEQVLTNLIVNALQSLGRGGRVWVTARRDGGGVEWSVEDDGPGVKLELRERIFEPFFTTKAHGQGTGLGLAIAAGIVRAHGGQISLEPPVGERVGARFRFALPRRRLARVELAAPRTASSAPSALRVLVVEDERTVREALRTFGERRGWRVDEAADGEEALTQLARAAPDDFDVVLCDVKMPRVSGIELYDRLKTEAPLWIGRLLYVTGDVVAEETQRFFARTRCPVVHKPFDFDFLQSEVERRAAAARA